MTTQDIYRLAIQLGLKNDPRGEGEVKNYINLVRKKFVSLLEKDKREFDQDKLFNPYSDTRILVDNQRTEIRKILVGIDMEGPELLLADKLGDIDLVIAHHPQGRAFANLHNVINMQAKMINNYGVSISVAEKELEKRVAEVGRSISPINHQRNIDLAKILNLDLICTHTIADNLAFTYVNNFLNQHKPEKLKDLLAILKEISEYKKAVVENQGPKIISGGLDNSCGKIIVDFTGGASLPKKLYEALSASGVNTIVTMHMKEAVLKEIRDTNLNIIVAGHMASDSIGMNLFLDELEKRGLEIVPISGLIRVKRF